MCCNLSQLYWTIELRAPPHFIIVHDEYIFVTTSIWEDITQKANRHQFINNNNRCIKPRILENSEKGSLVRFELWLHTDGLIIWRIVVSVQKLFSCVMTPWKKSFISRDIEDCFYNILVLREGIDFNDLYVDFYTDLRCNSSFFKTKSIRLLRSKPCLLSVSLKYLTHWNLFINNNCTF